MSIVNTNRLRTKKAISLFPGVHLRLLQRMTKTSFNTTRYHVRNLELSGEIFSTKEGGHERLYPLGLNERDRTLSAFVLDKTTRRIIQVLLESRPVGNREISNMTKVARSTVSEHIEALRKAEVVRRNVSLDGTVSYELLDREAAARILASFQANILATVADRFIDLWDL